MGDDRLKNYVPLDGSIKAYPPYNKLLTVSELKEIAASYLKSWLEKHDPLALYLLASLVFAYSEIVSKSIFEEIDILADPNIYFAAAFHEFEVRAKQGDCHAARFLSLYYLLGTHPVEKNEQQSLEWLRISADLGHPYSIEELKLHSQQMLSNPGT